MNEVKKGLFITVEGIDGAGKSTQIPVLAEAIKDLGVPLVRTREPGGTELGEKIRELLLHEEMSAKCELMLMFASRQENLDKVIKPAIQAGKWVLCDRFTDASYAYQWAGRQQPREDIHALEMFVHPDIKPDKTFLFDLDPEIAAKRLSGSRDRIESMDLDFHRRVRNAYLQMAEEEPNRYVVIDSTQTPEKISEQIRTMVHSWR